MAEQQPWRRFRRHQHHHLREALSRQRERYLALDRESGALTIRREAMRLAWYATRGTYEDERTGAADDALEPTSRNAWTAPSEPGPATLWVVLRDARGGVGFRAQTVIVR